MANTPVFLNCPTAVNSNSALPQYEAITISGSIAGVVRPGFSAGSGVQAWNCTAGSAGTAMFSGYSTQGAATNLAANPLFFSFRFRLTALPTTSDVGIARIVTSTSTLKMDLRIDSNGHLALYDSTTTLIATGTTVLAINTTYRIDLKAGNGTSSAYELRINEVSELSGTANLGATNVTRAGIGVFSVGGTATGNYYWFDIWGDTGAYAPNNYAVGWLAPASNGASTGWSGGTNTSDYTQINTQYLTTNYVKDPNSASPPVISTYGVSTFANANKGSDNSSGSAISASSIVAVKVFVLVVDDAAGVANTFKFGMTSGGTTTLNSVARNTPSSGLGAEDLAFFLLTDPNTSAAWTQSGVENALINIQEGTASVSTRCLQTFVTVGYVQAAAAANTTNFFAFFG